MLKMSKVSVRANKSSIDARTHEIFMSNLALYDYDL